MPKEGHLFPFRNRKRWAVRKKYDSIRSVRQVL